MADYAELVKAARSSARWIMAKATESSFAHDELKALHHADAVFEAADAIEELVAKVPTWISAKKPPEKPDFYWCNIENTVFPGRYYQEKLWYDNEFFVNVDGVCITHVTHYMPLPIPPQMEDIR